MLDAKQQKKKVIDLKPSKKTVKDFISDSDVRYQQMKTAEAEADEILSKFSSKRRTSQPENELPDKKNSKRLHKNSRMKSLKEDGKLLRRRYGNHVNQLVDLTNHLADDYHRLGQFLGTDHNGCDFSIDKLSKIHDSLLSVERQLDSISDSTT